MESDAVVDPLYIQSAIRSVLFDVKIVHWVMTTTQPIEMTWEN